MKAAHEESRTAYLSCTRLGQPNTGYSNELIKIKRKIFKSAPRQCRFEQDRHEANALAAALRCVYTEYDKIFRTYSDVGYETVRGYDVKLRHYPRHSRIQSLGASQNNRWEAKLFGFVLCEKYFRQLLTSKI